MLFPLFASKVGYYKNGIWWFTKIFNKIIGEKSHNYLRLERRIWQNRIWYTRQTFLFKCWSDYPEIAYLLGAYPKGDASHGFPHRNPYEVFRDFQENTPNSEGWFVMFSKLVLFVKSCHVSCSNIVGMPIPLGQSRSSLMVAVRSKK